MEEEIELCLKLNYRYQADVRTWDGIKRGMWAQVNRYIFTLQSDDINSIVIKLQFLFKLQYGHINWHFSLVQISVDSEQQMVGYSGIPPMRDPSHGIPPATRFLQPQDSSHGIPPMGFLPHWISPGSSGIPPMRDPSHGIPPTRDSSHAGFLPWDTSNEIHTPLDISHTGFLQHGIPPTGFLPHGIPPMRDSSHGIPPMGFIPH